MVGQGQPPAYTGPGLKKLIQKKSLWNDFSGEMARLNFPYGKRKDRLFPAQNHLKTLDTRPDQSKLVKTREN